MTRDPVCGKKVNKNKAYAIVTYNEDRYFLCCPLCFAEFEKNRMKYITASQDKRISELHTGKNTG